MVDTQSYLPHPSANALSLAHPLKNLISLIITEIQANILFTQQFMATMNFLARLLPLTTHQITQQKIHLQQKYKPITNPDYHSSNDSHIGQKTSVDLPPPFHVCNYSDPEFRQYNYWYHAQPDTNPPAKLM